MAALLLVSTGATQASAAIDAHPTAAAQQTWQTKISQLTRPAKGCYKADYPDLSWQKSACATPSTNPMVPRPALPMGPRTGPRPCGVPSLTCPW